MNKINPNFKFSTESEKYECTAKLLGLSKESLIHKVKHIDYIKSYIQIKENVYESFYKNPIDSWIRFCKDIDKVIEYINKEIPNWDELVKKEKIIYIRSWESVPEAPFIRGINLKYFIKFISNYELNEKRKVKIEYLLGLNLPNVNNEEIAMEVLEDTRLFSIY